MEEVISISTRLLNVINLKKSSRKCFLTIGNLANVFFVVGSICYCPILSPNKKSTQIEVFKKGDRRNTIFSFFLLQTLFLASVTFMLLLPHSIYMLLALTLQLGIIV